MYLDLIGTIPTEDETTTFLKDPSPEKRAALVDRLLASTRHADWFAMWYSNLLVGNQIRDRDLNRRTFNEWMRDQFARNRPYDELVYDLVTATGNSDSNGAVGFVSSFAASAADAAGKSEPLLPRRPDPVRPVPRPPLRQADQEGGLRVLRGVLLHDDPPSATRRRATRRSRSTSSSYPAEDFRSVGGGSKRTLGMGMMPRGQPLRLEGQVKGAAGRVFELGEPKFLLGKALKDVPGLDRRTILAKWMTSKSNEWFAPGLREPALVLLHGPRDRPPRRRLQHVEQAVEPRAAQVPRRRVRPRRLRHQSPVRAIVGSEAYQRTSKMPRDLERPDASLYAVAPVKPLTVEQSFDSLFRAAGAEQEVERRLEAGMKQRRRDEARSARRSPHARLPDVPPRLRRRRGRRVGGVQRARSRAGS